MILSLTLNLLIAFIWILLQPEPSGGGFVIGFALGFGLIALFQPVLKSNDYVRRTLAMIRFTGMFAREFLLASWQLARAALFRRSSSLSPRIISYDTRGLTHFEALLLSHCISLTPGTTTIDIAPDISTFTLHVLDCGSADAIRADIDRTLKSGILAFTR
jgi:multicomponent Na+:H+ antiporter subunit E